MSGNQIVYDMNILESSYQIIEYVICIVKIIIILENQFWKKWVIYSEKHPADLSSNLHS